MNLLNRTSIPYRKITVPCCNVCNTGYLSQIERSVRKVLQKGFLDTSENLLLMAQWLSKILIGILIKETGLLLDRSDPEKGPIVPPAYIEELRHCHYVMQSARKPMFFNCLHWDFPFSLFTYQILDDGRSGSFDLMTNIPGQSIAMRIGQLGIVFVNDGGLQMEIGPRGPFSLSGTSISGFQFSEIAARVHYKASLRDATHIYLTGENEQSVDIVQLQVSSYSGYLPDGQRLQIFRDWNEVELSHMLSGYMHLDRSLIFDDETGTCKTTLVDQNGRPLRDPNVSGSPIVEN
ncbi:hypothetical protein AAFN47_19580 [Hoeflea sp. CAU 1731]